MITLQHIYKTFDDKHIFEDLSLEIPNNGFFVIAGKSGCGKTTLLNLIGGLDHADSGEILVNGKELGKHLRSRKYHAEVVGFLFQNFALLEDKTVRQKLNIIPGKYRSGKTIEEVLLKVGLDKEMNTPVYKLSGCEQQRAALARLMYKKCDIILADEPTGSLDAGNRDLVMDYLHRLNDEGKTVVLVTHDQTIIEREKHVIWLNREKEK